MKRSRYWVSRSANHTHCIWEFQELPSILTATLTEFKEIFKEVSWRNIRWKQLKFTKQLKKFILLIRYYKLLVCWLLLLCCSMRDAVWWFWCGADGSNVKVGLSGDKLELLVLSEFMNVAFGTLEGVLHNNLLDLV